jgi:hypothetical protein
MAQEVDNPRVVDIHPCQSVTKLWHGGPLYRLVVGVPERDRLFGLMAPIMSNVRQNFQRPVKIRITCRALLPGNVHGAGRFAPTITQRHHALPLQAVSYTIKYPSVFMASLSWGQGTMHSAEPRGVS